MDSPAHFFDIAFAILVYNGLNSCLQGPTDVRQTHGRLVGLIDNLLASKGNMDKATDFSGKFSIDHIEDLVHNMVANKGSGWIGDRWRESFCFNGFHHRLDWQAGEVSGLAISLDGAVNGLVAFIVFNPSIINIDGYPLWGYPKPAPCLTNG